MKNMYNAILVLRTGEIISIDSIKLISWTRARIIFTDKYEKSYHYLTGDIIECKLSLIKEV